MSHFSCLVILEPGVNADDETIAERLAPFDENLVVEPYECNCYCINSIARAAGWKTAEAQVKPMNKLRDEWWAMPVKERPKWEDHIAPYQAVAESVEKAHPLYQKPDPNCKCCQGTGKRMTTYNPNSKWDWYVVGGRWDGALINKDGQNCNICKLKELDFDAMAKSIIESRKETWHKTQGKSPQVRELFFGIKPEDTEESYANKPICFATFAVLTPDGVWHERGKMGYFGIVIDEKEIEEDWNSRFYDRFLKDLSPESTLVIVDCHI